MAGHAQLKFVMTECSKTQIRLTGLSCNMHVTVLNLNQVLNLVVVKESILIEKNAYRIQERGFHWEI